MQGLGLTAGLRLIKGRTTVGPVAEDGTAETLRAQVEAARHDVAVLRDSARDVPDIKPLPPLRWSDVGGGLLVALFGWWLTCLAIFFVTWIAYSATGHAFRDGAGAAAILAPAYVVAALLFLARVIRDAKRRTL
jgi:hypothetical protein